MQTCLFIIKDRKHFREHFEHFRGFTLIELLTVIAIVGILAGLLFPVISSLREQANSIRCVSNLRQISLAGYLYSQDSGFYPGWGSGADRKELLYPYLHGGRSNTDLDGDQVWHCPSNELPEESAGYGFNTNLNWVRFDHINQPTRTVAVADAGITDALQPTLATHLMPPSRLSTPNIGRPNPRHGTRGGRSVNVAFVDGHVQSQEMEAPFYPGAPGEWFGNGITDPRHPDYQDDMWDLR